MAIVFLEKFVKKRFIFGQGVVKNLVVFQLADLESVQYTGLVYIKVFSIKTINMILFV